MSVQSVGFTQIDYEESLKIGKEIVELTQAALQARKRRLKSTIFDFNTGKYKGRIQKEGVKDNYAAVILRNRESGEQVIGTGESLGATSGAGKGELNTHSERIALRAAITNAKEEDWADFQELGDLNSESNLRNLLANVDVFIYTEREPCLGGCSIHLPRILDSSKNHKVFFSIKNNRDAHVNLMTAAEGGFAILDEINPVHHPEKKLKKGSGTDKKKSAEKSKIDPKNKVTQSDDFDNDEEALLATYSSSQQPSSSSSSSHSGISSSLNISDKNSSGEAPKNSKKKTKKKKKKPTPSPRDSNASSSIIHSSTTSIPSTSQWSSPTPSKSLTSSSSSSSAPTAQSSPASINHPSTASSKGKKSAVKQQFKPPRTTGALITPAFNQGRGKGGSLGAKKLSVLPGKPKNPPKLGHNGGNDEDESENQ